MRTVWSLAGLAVIGGCTASASDVKPKEEQLFFPTGLAIAPDESALFVANANSELRYDSGALSVIDLASVESVVDAWANGDPGNCNADPDHRETLICDETPFLRLGSGVRIGNFATDIAVQDFGNGNLRLLVPTRGDPSISWANYDGTSLHCTTSEGTFELCDDAHRLSYLHNDPNGIAVPEEPFGVFADPTNGFAIVTHLTTGSVTLIDSPPNNDNVEVADIIQGVFAADLSGLRGATGVAGRTPQAVGDIVYVGSRTENRIQTFTVGRPVNGASPYLLLGNFFFLNAVGINAGASVDTRGMQFSADGTRLYLINRDPPTLQVYDTSLDVTGFPKNSLLGASDICRQASTLSIVDSGDGERAYVTCFQDGQLYVIDPTGTTQVEDVIEVGRGPYSVVAAKNRKKLYVTNFLEDTIAVIDVAPGSPTRDRVVLRVGEPKTP